LSSLLEKRLNSFAYKYNSDDMSKKVFKSRKETIKELEKDGWKIKINMLDAVRKDDSVWWYELGGETIFSASKGTKTVSIEVRGDISIYDENYEDVYFVCKEGGKPDGELTQDLVKNGEWNDNNWFEINFEDSKTKEFKTVDVPTSLQVALNTLMETVEKIDEGKENEIQNWF